MLLSLEELQELSGAKYKSKIMHWLDSKGINYLVGADGYPKVDKEYVQDMLRGNIAVRSPQRKHGNVNALREMMGIK